MIRFIKKHRSLVCQILFIIIMLCIWETAAGLELLGPNSGLIFPSLEAVMEAFVRNFVKGYAGLTLWVYVGNSMLLLLEGMMTGVILAFLFSGLSMISSIFHAAYNLIISVFDLLPVVIIVFGVKQGVIVFLVVHAVVWPMSRNLLDGFKAVPRIYVEAGENIGLHGMSLLLGIYLPASVSYIISGLKVGWARAWRGLISAEMIFGVAAMPGIGLFINQMRTNLKNAEMYATLLVIVIIGLVVQYGIFAPIENNTVKKWGMSK